MQSGLRIESPWAAQSIHGSKFTEFTRTSVQLFHHLWFLILLATVVHNLSIGELVLRISLFSLCRLRNNVSLSLKWPPFASSNPCLSEHSLPYADSSWLHLFWLVFHNKGLSLPASLREPLPEISGQLFLQKERCFLILLAIEQYISSQPEFS